MAVGQSSSALISESGVEAGGFDPPSVLTLTAEGLGQRRRVHGPATTRMMLPVQMRDV